MMRSTIRRYLTERGNRTRINADFEDFQDNKSAKILSIREIRVLFLEICKHRVEEVTGL